MRALRFSAIRKQLAGPGYRDGVHRHLSSSIVDAEWIVRLYYAASIYIAARLMMSVDIAARETTDWDFLWPLAWLNAVDIDVVLALRLIGLASFLSSLVAFAFHRVALARGASLVCFFLAATVPNSFGGINHPYHAWMWVGFVFVFLPDGTPTHFGRAGKLAYLTVIRGAQALFMLFYSMAGAWKLGFGVFDLLSGQPGNLSPGALAWTLAGRSLQTGTEPLLAPLVIENVWLSWPMLLAIIYIQFTALAIAFRPRLHVAWGYLLVAFHVGTWLLMEIMFVEHILLLVILLVLSPQRRAYKRLAEAIADLPLIGWIVRRRLLTLVTEPSRIRA